ncbi:AbrB/MazE/SpoVT family DNA-binding domain-containing protein [uncultured Paracoccus sp.]|uniref:AbrB/MazE/SpoVT family DNA-binding domain-containing protein n=1 Tax=uncultured Paracoccus sp. TaxID=189685 RepID=UPI002623347F|nr:AbrB/MazE/SpoVT family DNA-binding domain-containing protein [uncultured Paracoccus sp.]
MSARVKITATGRLSLPADIRKRHGLGKGGDVLIEDRGDEIVIWPLNRAVARAQEISRKLTADKQGASVQDFLADRRREAEAE